MVLLQNALSELDKFFVEKDVLRHFVTVLDTWEQTETKELAENGLSVLPCFRRETLLSFQVDLHHLRQAHTFQLLDGFVK